jgi:hypothetical protein
VFRRLVAEHRESALLLERLRETRGLEKRHALWMEASTTLIAHERAELREVYNVFHAYPALQAIADEHTRQAGSIETLVNELDALPISSPDWLLTLQRLIATVNQHVEEEETDFLPRAQATIGVEKAEQLEGPYLASRRATLRTL